MIKAVLFDMDGLLADTENLNIEVAIKICKGLGIDLTLEEQQNCVGVTSLKFYKELFEKRYVNFDIQEVLKKHFEAYEKSLKTNLKTYPGAQTSPKKLKAQGYKLALVSGSTKSQIDIVLKRLGLKNSFDVVVSADDIIYSKPDPQGFLMAAKSLQISPQECVVLEDATTGVTAAKKAGMKVVGIVNKGGQDLFLADIIFENLAGFTIETLPNL